MANQMQVQCFPNLKNLELIQAVDVIHHFSRHVHDSLCVGIIEKGARECQVHGAKEVAAQGQIVIINANELHACASAGGMPYSYQILCLNVSCIQNLQRQYTDKDANMPYFKNTVIDDPIIFANITKLGTLLGRAASQLENETLLIEIFAGLIIRHAAEKNERKVTGREDNMVRKVREYIEAHCTEEILLEELSNLVNFSPYYLHRAFTAQVGIPLHAYQILFKINRAKNLLMQGKPLAMAAFETGFVDQSHFSRRFKEIVGLTPGQWLKARRAH